MQFLSVFLSTLLLLSWSLAACIPQSYSVPVPPNSLLSAFWLTTFAENNSAFWLMYGHSLLVGFNIEKWNSG
jgi:hypothetical protein